MTTQETLKQSYHAAAKALHYAALNDRATDAQQWALVLDMIATQLRGYGESVPQLADAE